MTGKEFIIIGDTKDYKGCLVCLAGRTQERAEEVLAEVLAKKAEGKDESLNRHENLRIKEIDSKDGWWNYGTD